AEHLYRQLDRAGRAGATGHVRHHPLRHLHVRGDHPALPLPGSRHLAARPSDGRHQALNPPPGRLSGIERPTPVWCRLAGVAPEGNNRETSMAKPQPASQGADDYLIRPDPADPRLSERVSGLDQAGARVETTVVVERPLTIFLNAQEIVTAMTIG